MFQEENKVWLFFLITINYVILIKDWVIKLGPATYGSENKYQYAIVSDNVKATLFVLARDPEVFKRDYEAEVLQFLKEKGFTTIVNRPVKTYHESDCIYNDQHQWIYLFIMRSWNLFSDKMLEDIYISKRLYC